MSKGSGHNEIDYNLPKNAILAVYTIELECILNGLPWRRFGLSECF